MKQTDRHKIKQILKVYLRFIFLFSFLLSTLPVTEAAETEFPEKAFNQKFVITAYYSPTPDQCCYVRGGFEAEKVLQGEGIKGADLTPVYAGMAAAPPWYPFGTVIELPGIGTVKVHDRGGAIQILEDSDLGESKNDTVHRLDIWMGYGEEGFARALNFGVQRVTGRVYPGSSRQPKVSLKLDDFESPHQILAPYLTKKLIELTLKKGDKSAAVMLLQKYLQELDYYSGKIDGIFTENTETSLKKFITAYNLNEPSDYLTEYAAAVLMAAYERRSADLSPVSDFVDAGETSAEAAQAQRVLRYLGYYSGRTTRTYDDNLRAAIISFQLNNGVIKSEQSLGAGRIGPGTKKAIAVAWGKKQTLKRAKQLQDYHRIDKYLEQTGEGLDYSYLKEGYGGAYAAAQVTVLQKILSALGFFDKKNINGSFGPITTRAVIDYQLDRKIITSADFVSAGYVGPNTISNLKHEKRLEVLRKVRAEGWGVL